MQRIFAENLCAAVVAQLKRLHPERTVISGPKPQAHAMTSYGFALPYSHAANGEVVDFQYALSVLTINASGTLASINLALSKHVWFHIYSQGNELVSALVVSPVPV